MMPKTGSLSPVTLSPASDTYAVDASSRQVVTERKTGMLPERLAHALLPLFHVAPPSSLIEMPPTTSLPWRAPSATA